MTTLCPYCHNNEVRTVRWIDRRTDNRLIHVTTEYCTQCGEPINEIREETRVHEVFGHN